MNKTIIFVIIITLLSSQINSLISTYRIQPNTIDFSTRFWGINPIHSLCIPQNLVLRSIALGETLIY